METQASTTLSVVEAFFLITQAEIGVLGGSRTHDITLRRGALYPAELRRLKLILSANAKIIDSDKA